MKVRHLIFLLVLLFSLVHFSSQYTLAEEENDEQVSQEKIEGEGESSEKENDDNLSSEESEHSPSEENNNENPEVDSNESLIENEEIIEVEAEEPIEVSSMVSDGNLFKRGDSDPRIIQLKIDLAKLGFPVSNNPNENFGPSTEEAVKDFQSYFAIEVHGMADETTLNKIDEILSTPLQNGGNHADAITLKENLSKLGFHVSNNPNTAYGPTTERRVREFQAFYNLRENGIADEVTLAKIEELINTPMSRGDYRQDVVDLKVKLAEVGFAVSANPNPQFGPSTERIVKDFQSYYGLESHGRADNATLAKIEEVLGSPFRSGRNHEDTITLKENLSRLGFHVSDNPNTAYGPSTEARVKEFQSYYGLVANGIGDEVTLAKLEELLSSSFQNGESHEDVITLKENLSKLGFHVSDNPNTVYGPMTERRVREFQAYYGLVVNGMADEATLNKIDEILSTPLQNGGNHADAITLKEHLSKLGFHVSNNPNTAYGPTTERRVREFQAFYNLRENGIADEVTLAKIEELINTPMSRGDYRQDVVDLKIKLAEIGFAISPDPTPQFGPSTEQAVKDFQSYYGLSSSGIVNDATLNKIEEILNSPFRNGRNHEDTITLKENLSKLGFHVSNNPNTAYGPSTERRVKEFQEYYGLLKNGIVDEPTMDKINNLLNWPLRNGQSSPEVMKLKMDLALLGYHISNNPNENYGPATEKAVRDFQSDNNLRVNGIFDDPTKDKLNTLISELSLANYGKVTASALNVRSQASTNGSILTQISRNTIVEILGSESNGWYRVKVNGITGYVSGTYIELVTQPLSGRIIVLDAGHGGSDPGAIAGGMQEKELVLDVSLRAQKLLEEAGATVIMTRTTDVYPTLAQRASIANSSNADVFLSVHANAFNGSANGTETYWYNSYQSNNSQRLANTIQSATLSKLGLRDRGVKLGNFHVIRETRIPSALLELGFMDHSGDAAVLRQSSSRDRAAEAIRDGMINYFN
ncbi:peptidoglycan-binding protein [Salipaludibacillus agaradhaerens]|uniref:peptidoglycan-binding protein n=1 Tax=Salipaludibacillus agaradhaerens TaxID=76935 RepID=UPI0009975FA8|nr:peptidoglycan-binding protein [Salipaludibacillus agaradhaerens]